MRSTLRYTSLFLRIGDGPLGTRSELLFWFAQPPKVEAGAYNAVAGMWGNKVSYVCWGEWGEERVSLRWDDDEYDGVNVVHLEGSKSKYREVEKIIKDHPDAIHILPGFTSDVSTVVLGILSPSAKVCVVTERPVPFYTKDGAFYRVLRKFYKQLRYRQLRLKYSDKVDLVLPLGMTGVKSYRDLGWDDERLAPFMYCPNLKMLSPNHRNVADGCVRFLYVGRFMYSTKGIDFLQKAVESLPRNDSWALDMVGGYGVDRDSVLSWIDNQTNVNFLGSWKSDEVIENMSSYDAVLVPSKGEGWNMIPHQAIAACVGVICTDEAVSDEIVSSSGAGRVVKSFSSNELARAMKEVLDDPSLTNEWKDKAYAFQERLDVRCVADYFVRLLDWKFYGIGQKPICPWL